jgi:hypothetical protein
MHGQVESCHGRTGSMLTGPALQGWANGKGWEESGSTMNTGQQQGKARVVCGSILFWIAFFGTAPQRASAQRNSPNDASTTAARSSIPWQPSPGAKPTSAKENEQILQELERMRTRIEQLEAQLKASERDTSAEMNTRSTPEQSAVARGEEEPAGLASANSPVGTGKLSPTASEELGRDVPAPAAAAQGESPTTTEASTSGRLSAGASGISANGQAGSNAVPENSLENLLRGTTVNFLLDGYYAYNFNAPIGRANLLRAYDVSSNSFSINQADLVLENAPDPDHGKRYGARIDFQYGQATQTLQGNSANEQRPDIYRALFQAYGTYIVPVGSGLRVDFGKWASALGIENNYTKDQNDYSRSFWFNFLPFYHMGVRTSYQVNHWLTANYWLVNGAQQTEDFNGFKDQLFGVVVQPKPSVSWTVNYYFGQEHPDFAFVPGGTGLPVVQGEPFAPIPTAPNGKLHIFDSYVSWNASPKLSLALEGDYVVERLFTSSAPAHTDGGAAYVRYQLTPKFALASRAEYMSDRGGLFSGTTQALKEVTLTGQYQFYPGFMMFEEWRRDFSNRPYFLTDTLGLLQSEQTTATAGVVWWFGPKTNSW